MILIADAVSERCDAVLRDHAIDVVRAVGVPLPVLLAQLVDAEGMIVRSAVQVDRAVLDAAPGLRVIGRAGVGVDNVDVAAATERGVVVVNTPDGNTISACEHAVALLFAMLRRIPAAVHSLEAGEWKRSAFTGNELFGKTVGIVGVGRIGREVAARLAPFGVLLLGHDPVIGEEGVRAHGLVPVSFEELLERADILSIHVPLLPATRGMIGAEALGRMKTGSWVVNCARGGVVDERALRSALDSGQIVGAALDVFEQEPPGHPHLLVGHPRVIATPHIAASTHEAQERVAVEVAMQVAAYLQGRPARGIVNPEAAFR